MSSQQVSFKKNKGGRPATGKGTLVGVSFRPGMLAAIDEYCARSGLTRTDAVRALLKLGLASYNASIRS